MLNDYLYYSLVNLSPTPPVTGIVVIWLRIDASNLSTLCNIQSAYSQGSPLFSSFLLHLFLSIPYTQAPSFYLAPDHFPYRRQVNNIKGLYSKLKRLKHNPLVWFTFLMYGKWSKRNETKGLGCMGWIGKGGGETKRKGATIWYAHLRIKYRFSKAKQHRLYRHMTTIPITGGIQYLPNATETTST